MADTVEIGMSKVEKMAEKSDRISKSIQAENQLSGDFR